MANADESHVVGDRGCGGVGGCGGEWGLHGWGIPQR